jgi:hypothetical protein
MYENRMLRRIFTPKREKIQKDGEIVHIDELNNYILHYYYYSHDQIRENVMSGALNIIGNILKFLQNICQKTEGEDTASET